MVDIGKQRPCVIGLFSPVHLLCDCREQAFQYLISTFQRWASFRDYEEAHLRWKVCMCNQYRRRLNKSLNDGLWWTWVRRHEVDRFSRRNGRIFGAHKKAAQTRLSFLASSRWWAATRSVLFRENVALEFGCSKLWKVMCASTFTFTEFYHGSGNRGRFGAYHMSSKFTDSCGHYWLPIYISIVPTAWTKFNN